jgi:hypothetical protein
VEKGRNTHRIVIEGLLKHGHHVSVKSLVFTPHHLSLSFVIPPHREEERKAVKHSKAAEACVHFRCHMLSREGRRREREQKKNIQLFILKVDGRSMMAFGFVGIQHYAKCIK